jgi:two-component system NarL family sensor kinase
MQPKRKHLIVARKQREPGSLSSRERSLSADTNSIPPGISSFRSKHPLQAASRPLATLAQTFDEFLFELDADGKFQGVWSSSPALTNARRGELLGRHAMEVLGEEVFRPFSAVFHRVIESQQSDGIEFRVDSNDGERWFYARVLPVARRNGQPPSVSLLTHDISAQKKTEEKLRKSEALLAQAEQLVNMGSWEIDTTLQTLTCSENLYGILGLDSENRELNLREIQDRRLLPEEAEMARKDLRAAVEDGVPFVHDLRYTRPDGATRNLHVRGFPFHDASVRVVRVVGVTEDVTDRLKVEEGLRRASERVFTLRDDQERRVARDLHETASQDMAALKMALARVGETLPKRNRVANTFLQSAREFAEEAIQHIRTVSYSLHPILLDEAGLATALRSFVNGFAERSGIPVKLKIKRGFGTLPQEMDIALFRVVQEALTNIHRHSKSRVAKITLERLRDKVHLTIADRGVGMPPASAATGWNQPMGIGIAGMRERVKHLGGVFDIQSEPGRGTTISVELPLSKAARTPDVKQKEMIRDTKTAANLKLAPKRG